MRKNVSERKLEQEERKFDWELSNELFSPGSDASESDTYQMRQLMRKGILWQLNSQLYERIPSVGPQVKSAPISASDDSSKEIERNIVMVNESGRKEGSPVHQEVTCSESLEMKEGGEGYSGISSIRPQEGEMKGILLEDMNSHPPCGTIQRT